MLSTRLLHRITFYYMLLTVYWIHHQVLCLYRRAPFTWAQDDDDGDDDEYWLLVICY